MSKLNEFLDYQKKLWEYDKKRYGVDLQETRSQEKKTDKVSNESEPKCCHNHK